MRYEPPLSAASARRYEPSPGITHPGSLRRSFRVEAKDQLSHLRRHGLAGRFVDDVAFARGVLPNATITHFRLIGISGDADKLRRLPARSAVRRSLRSSGVLAPTTRTEADGKSWA